MRGFRFVVEGSSPAYEYDEMIVMQGDAEIGRVRSLGIGPRPLGYVRTDVRLTTPKKAKTIPKKPRTAWDLVGGEDWI